VVVITVVETHVVAEATVVETTVVEIEEDTSLHLNRYCESQLI